METTVSLNFDISLKKLAMYKLAAVLWKSQPVINEIESYGTKIFNILEVFDPECNWYKISKKILDYIDTLNFPSDLRLDFKNVVLLTGKNIHSWLEYLHETKIFGFSYLYNFHFTSLNTIDEIRIYEDLKEDTIFQKILKKKKFLLYRLASCYADVRLIAQSLTEIAKLVSINNGITIKDVNKFKVSSAMTILLILVAAGGEISKFNDLYKDLKNSEYSGGIDKMFLLCAGFGMREPAEYYYEKLKKKDQPEVLYKACLQRGLLFRDLEISQHELNRSSQLLVYLFTKMTSEQKKEFLLKNIMEIYDFFLNAWPYQDYCISLVNYVWDDLPQKVHLDLLQRAYDAFKTVLADKRRVYDRIFLPVMLSIMSKLPEDIKINFFRKNFIVFELFNESNFLSLKILLEDPDLMKHRAELLTDIDKKSLTNYLKNGGDSQNIKDYMTAFRFSNDEKNKLIGKFSDDLNLLTELLKDGRFDVADDVLKWQCYFKDDEKITEEKFKIKEELALDVLVVCDHLGKKYCDFDLIVKYIIWLYGYDEKEEDIIAAEISFIFVCIDFWEKWMRHCKNVKSAKKMCSKFIKESFETEHDLSQFKEKLLENYESFIKFLLNSDGKDPSEVMLIYKVVSQLDEVFKAFSFSVIEINQIKQKLKSNSEYWMKIYIANFFFNFLALDAFVDWISDTNEERATIIKSLMNTNDRRAVLGVGICLLTWETDLPRHFLVKSRDVFLLKWVKPYGFTDSMKQDIIRLKIGKNPIFLKEAIEMIQKLDKLKH